MQMRLACLGSMMPLRLSSPYRLTRSNRHVYQNCQDQTEHVGRFDGIAWPSSSQVLCLSQLCRTASTLSEQLGHHVVSPIQMP